MYIVLTFSVVTVSTTGSSFGGAASSTMSTNSNSGGLYGSKSQSSAAPTGASSSPTSTSSSSGSLLSSKPQSSTPSSNSSFERIYPYSDSKSKFFTNPLHACWLRSLCLALATSPTSSSLTIQADAFANHDRISAASGDWGGIIHRFQSIYATQKWKLFSQEELRLQFYQEHRRWKETELLDHLL